MMWLPAENYQTIKNTATIIFYCKFEPLTVHLLRCNTVDYCKWPNEQDGHRNVLGTVVFSVWWWGLTKMIYTTNKDQVRKKSRQWVSESSFQNAECVFCCVRVWILAGLGCVFFVPSILNTFSSALLDLLSLCFLKSFKCLFIPLHTWNISFCFNNIFAILFSHSDWSQGCLSPSYPA